MNKENNLENLVLKFRKDFIRLCDEINRVIVGYREIIENVAICLFAEGNVLLEGVPGLGKTVLVKTLSKTLDIPFARIQFTPDLMPADIIGTNLIEIDSAGNRSFRFQQGPIFTNIVLADEINRATPKTQSALLECMQEQCITSSGETRQLDKPFFVLATQNPLEMEGTYPLPEAQLDRFMFKILVPYPSLEDLNEILKRTTEKIIIEPNQRLNKDAVLDYIKFLKEIYIAPHVRDYASRLVLATHPNIEFAPAKVKKYVRYGSSPRGAQALILSSKIRAVIDKRYNVSFEDIKKSALPSLRHRLILNFEGEAEQILHDDVVEEIINTIPQSMQKNASYT